MPYYKEETYQIAPISPTQQSPISLPPAARSAAPSNRQPRPVSPAGLHAGSFLQALLGTSAQPRPASPAQPAPTQQACAQNRPASPTAMQVDRAAQQQPQRSPQSENSALNVINQSAASAAVQQTALVPMSQSQSASSGSVPVVPAPSTPAQLDLNSLVGVLERMAMQQTTTMKSYMDQQLAVQSAAFQRITDSIEARLETLTKTTAAAESVREMVNDALRSNIAPMIQAELDRRIGLGPMRFGPTGNSSPSADSRSDRSPRSDTEADGRLNYSLAPRMSRDPRLVSAILRRRGNRSRSPRRRDQRDDTPRDATHITPRTADRTAVTDTASFQSHQPQPSAASESNASLLSSPTNVTSISLALPIAVPTAIPAAAVTNQPPASAASAALNQ